MYVYYYLHTSGVEDLKYPWDSCEIYVNASGDDVVIWCHPRLARDLAKAILSKTTRNRKALNSSGVPNIIGLGQCIAEVFTTEWYNFDFCSMWTFTQTGEIGDLVLTPDFSKLFTKKQFYTKKNAHIHGDPAIYIAAKLLQVQLARVSKCMEGVLYAQLRVCEARRGKIVTGEEAAYAYKAF